MTPALILLAAVVALLAWGLARAYRALARLDRQVRLAWGQVEWAYAGRRDLARELTLASQPQGTGPAAGALKAVADALVLSAQANDPLARRQGEAELGAALKALFQIPASGAAWTNGPEAGVWRERFAAATHRIRMAQRFYNDQALVYNAKLSTMPLALAARAGGLRPADLTDGDDHGA
jgi:hypothetical protein